MSKNVKLIIACHKACEVPADPIYFPVFVGSEGRADIPGFQRDDEGEENISAKNPSYCELTGLYWAWKNLDCEYLGLVHYRRYFTVKKWWYRKHHEAMDAVLSSAEIQTLLAERRVLVPRKQKYFIESIYSHYAHTFVGTHLDETKRIIEKHCPEYLEDFENVMKGTSAHMFNMFVMPKRMVDDYCKWLFPILSELEERVDTSKMSPFEIRYIGRVSEILFNVWLTHLIRVGKLDKNEIREVPWVYIGKIQWKEKIIGFLKAKFFHKKYEQSF